MGFRFQRSIRVLPGLRLNFSKSGVGWSVGPRGYRVSRSATGRRRRTISIPGTGMSWIAYGETGATRRDSRPGPPPGSGRATPPGKPGLFAPRGEKDLYAAIGAGDPAAMEQVGAAHPAVAVAAMTTAGFTWLQQDHDAAGLAALQWVFDTGVDPGTDRFMQRYVAIAITLEVVPGVSASLPADRDTVGLMLGELYQREGRLEQAIAVVEQLEPTVLVALSLAELLDQQGRSAEVIELTQGVPNTDDATSLLWVFRGNAFRDQGNHAAARECYARVTRSRSRSAPVRHRALLERAWCHAAEGRRAQARRDLARIQAEDPTFDGLAEALDDLGGSGGS